MTERQAKAPERTSFVIGLVMFLTAIAIMAFLFSSDLQQKLGWTPDPIVVGIGLVVVGRLAVNVLDPVLRRWISTATRWERRLPTWLRAGLIAVISLVVAIVLALLLGKTANLLIPDDAGIALGTSAPEPFDDTGQHGWGSAPISNTRDGPSHPPRFNIYQDVVLGGINIGNEYDFVRVVDRNSVDNSGGDAFETFGGSSNRMAVAPGDSLTLLIYVHNGQDDDYNGASLDGQSVALNPRVSVLLPEVPGEALVLRGWIEASNSEPRWLTDSVLLFADEPILVRMVPGSGQRHANYYGLRQDSRIGVPDAVVTKSGASLDVPGSAGLPACWGWRSIVSVNLLVEAAPAR